MKKIFVAFLMITLIISLSHPALAYKIGDVIGKTLTTDIVAQINGYDIPSYNYNGYTYIIAEDLKNYGFSVTYDNASRTLSVKRDYGIIKINSTYEKPSVSSADVGKTAFKILYTDIITYVDGKYVNSYNINGQTIIAFDDIASYGSYIWDNSTRKITLDISGIEKKKVPFDKVYNTNSIGTVSGTITYKYNNYRGHVGDTGAHIILIPTDTNTKDYENSEAVMGIAGTYESGIRVTKVDGTGNYTFNYVPSGNYHMIVVSGNTTSSLFFDNKEYVEESLKNAYSKYFNDSDLSTFILFTELQKYTSTSVKVTENYNFVFSYDFGTTYL